MSVCLSKSQIDRLGLRLVGDGGPAEEDLEQLHALLLARSEQLDRAEASVREELGVVPTSRVKNTETILEKLRRAGGSGLKSIQDLAGMRITGDFDRRGQDELVARIVTVFGDGARTPKIIDRRAEPMHGYRAVHVIVFPEGAPIEIQVRTAWQHEWAEFFEKLADQVGRGIRYGEPPAKWWTAEEDRASVLKYFELEYEVRESVVGLALGVAELVNAVEAGEAAAPLAPELVAFRRKVDKALGRLQESLHDIDDVDETVGRLWP